jgi:PAS domain S-box-containing protein
MQTELHQLLDALPCLVWTADVNGQLRFVSRRWKEWTGTRGVDALDAGWQSSVHPDDREGAARSFSSIVASGKPGEFEVRMRYVDGTWRWVLHRMSPIADDAGRIVEWCGVTNDIERLKRAEAALRSVSEEGFRAIWETTPECVKVIARDGTLLRANAAGVAMSGAPSEEVILGKCFYDFVAPHHRERYVAFNERVCDGQKGFLEFDLINAQGRLYHMETHAAPMHHRDGSIVQLGVTRDITQRRSSEEALATARTELAHMTRIMSMSTLTASIAHEVNQPLAGIVTNAATCLHMLSAAPPDVSGAREAVRRTLRDANLAADVVQRLRGMFTHDDPEPERVDLNDATREVIALSEGELQRGRVTLRTALARDLPDVVGDRVQLQQVLINLMRNAVDAMKGVDGRRDLTIETALEDGDQVRVSVEDTGVGLDPAGMAQLFQAFHSTKPDGMGIGLSISRTIIENHRGRLWASPNAGPGATFSFSIPRGVTA